MRIALAAFENLIVLLGLTFLLAQGWRYLSALPERRRQLGVGAAFGLIAIGTLLVAFPLAPGVIADLRNVAVASAALFGGWLAVLVAALIAGGFRAALGGSLAGSLIGIGAVALVSAGFAELFRRRNWPLGPPAVMGLGLLLAAVNTVAPFWRQFLGLQPFGPMAAVAQTIFLAAGTLYPIGLLMVWYALTSEGRRIRGEGELRTAIADRARTAAELRASQARFQAIMDHAPLVIAVKDRDGRYVFVNRNFEDHFGIRAETVLGQTSYALAPKEFADRYTAQDREVITTGKPIQAEFTGPTVRGMRTSLVIKFPMLGANGEVETVGMVLADVTERREQERRLGQAQRMEAVGQLTGGIAHDFNNLLTVIIGNAELLRERLEGNAELAHLAEVTESAADRGAALVQRLLAFGRRQPLEAEAVDVNDLIAGMGALLHRTLGEHIEVATVAGRDLWPARVDANQLETALLNLAVNARDAMPAGGRLELRTENVQLDDAYARTVGELAPGDYVRILVSDSGEGMTPEVQARAFEPFFTTKEVGKGTGLGLSMVYGFAKQSGGHVTLYSEPGHGTTVRLYLPRAAAAGAGREPPAPDPPAAMPGGTETILLVEDDPLVRGHNARLLESLGYRVLAAENGRAALGLLRAGAEPQLLFTDMVMPGGMDGRALADEVRRMKPGIRVLFTSGYTEYALGPDANGGRPVHLLGKPYGPRELGNRIRQVLDENQS